MLETLRRGAYQGDSGARDAFVVEMRRRNAPQALRDLVWGVTDGLRDRDVEVVIRTRRCSYLVPGSNILSLLYEHQAPDVILRSPVKVPLVWGPAHENRYLTICEEHVPPPETPSLASRKLSVEAANYWLAWRQWRLLEYLFGQIS